MTPFRPLLFCAALALAAPAAGSAWAQPRQARVPALPAPAGAPVPSEKIVAVINGDVITSADVEARGRLFALSTGLPITQDVLDRLRPQVTRQLIDERLRLQEVQRRKISVSDKEIADAIGEIEQRNGMPKGALAASLRGRGVVLRTLIDQVRVQIGWTRVLRDELGDKAQIGEPEIAEQRRLFKAQIGQPEFHVGEIFIPIEDPAKAADAQRFADTVIQQLRAGAPVPVVAAQFSQSQTALQGGDLGWLRANQMDPEVAAIVNQMPPGAVSNPIRVPGGISIVNLTGKREIGRDQSTVLSLRQVFLPFVGQLNPAAPTDQQRKAVEQAAAIAKSVKTCSDMEQANEKAGKVRPTDPGEVRLEGVGSPPLRALLTSQPLNQPTKPIVTGEGVAVLMVCSREQRAATEPSRDEITSRLLNDRIELASRQLQRDLRRRAVMDDRS